MKKAPSSDRHSAAIERRSPKRADKRPRKPSSHPRADAFLIPKGKRPTLAGIKVVAWMSQAETAEALGISTRWLQKLESRGLPADGHRASCRYALPHTLIWVRQWRIAKVAGEKLGTLPFAVALARHTLENAVEDAVYDYRQATDPLYAELRGLPDTEGRQESAQGFRDKIRARDAARGQPWEIQWRLMPPMGPEFHTSASPDDLEGEL